MNNMASDAARAWDDGPGGAFDDDSKTQVPVDFPTVRIRRNVALVGHGDYLGSPRLDLFAAAHRTLPATRCHAEGM